MSKEVFKKIPTVVLILLGVFGVLGYCSAVFLTNHIADSNTGNTATPTRTEAVSSLGIVTDASATPVIFTPTSSPNALKTSTPFVTRTPSATATQTPYPTASPTPTPTEAHKGEPAVVIDVVDGDTIKVIIDNQQYTVRYIGIDTPETVHPSKPVEWMGAEASARNKELVSGKTVYLESDVSNTDRYGRLLRYIFLADGTFVNKVLVEEGYAHASEYPPDTKYQDVLEQSQREAMEQETGLWSEKPDPTATATHIPTATPTVVQPTAETPPSTTAPVTPGEVQITYILADGVVSRVESDEYAVVENIGGAEVSIGGFRLNAGDPGQDFVFPDYVLQPGQSCRVYTNEMHLETCGFSFGIGKAIWNNSGDCGFLYNQQGEKVSEYCY
jgi:endonuclease YncB( thermonuclease family)